MPAQRDDPMVARRSSKRCTARWSRRKTRRAPTYRRATRDRHAHLQAHDAARGGASSSSLSDMPRHGRRACSSAPRSIDRHIDEYEDIVQKTDRAVRMPLVDLVAGAVLRLAARAVHRGRRCGHQLLADRPADGRDGRRQQLHRQLADGRHRRAGDHPGRGVDGPLPDGVAAHHPAVPGDRRAAGQVARDAWSGSPSRLFTALACVEAGLAYMREVLLEDELATTALLRGDERRASSAPGRCGSPPPRRWAWASSCRSR